MKKTMTPKKVVHYAIFLTLAWVGYRFYSNYQSGQDNEPRPYGPRDLRRGQHNKQNQDVEEFQNDGPMDLDKRLKAIEKELERQRRLKSQQGQSKDNGNLRDEIKLEQNDRNFERGQQEKEHQRKDARDHGDKQDRVERDSLGNTKKSIKQSHYRDENVDKQGHWEQRYQRDAGKGVGKPTMDEKAAKEKNTVEEFVVEPKVDWKLEEELQRRRKDFNEKVAQRAEAYNPQNFQDMHESDDHLAFVTVGSDHSWDALQQFIYSIQYFYPDSDIGIMDMGFSEEKRQKLETMCSVTVLTPFQQLWPEHMKDPTKKLWRPMVWQMGLANYGHMVYVEPDRYLHTNNMRHYIQHSRRRGITVVGKKLNYSPFVVTHPEMYYFFNVDTRKLQRVSMFDITMLIMHNSEPVRHEFMRYLMSCLMEEYCIAPPGAKTQCDHRFYGGSKKYANCHRYEMSAVNILLNKWFQFKQDEYLVRDIATKHYDGTDVSARIRFCKEPEQQHPKEEI